MILRMENSLTKILRTKGLQCWSTIGNDATARQWRKGIGMTLILLLEVVAASKEAQEVMLGIQPQISKLYRSRHSGN